MFCDLQTHTYSEQSRLSPISKSVTATYNSLETALASKITLTAKSINKMRKITSPLYFEYLALLKFEEANGRWPLDTDFEALWKIAIEVCLNFGVPPELVDQDQLKDLSRTAEVQFAPVSAILGGLVSQEVLKTLSGKEAPMNNFLLLDVSNSETFVMKVPASLSINEEINAVIEVEEVNSLDKGKGKEIESEAV
ncbi:hypothetical protein HK096_001221, partial [Nowakowskiella sp. JEL0078]